MFDPVCPYNWPDWLHDCFEPGVIVLALRQCLSPEADI